MNKEALFGGLLLLALAGCAERMPTKPSFEPVSFASLEGWKTGNQSGALGALKKSCAIWMRKDRDWSEGCSALAHVGEGDNAAARKTIEAYFSPFALKGDGLFTGYYEASLEGRFQKQGDFDTPLWKKPNDLISVNLGDFNPDLKGKKIAGKISGDKLVPYEDRAALRKSPKGLEPLLWVRDPIDAFFLEIQGSGRVYLEGGRVVRVGFAAQNGRTYVPIGRVLASMGEIDKPVTMEKIRLWLYSHPGRATEIMDQNPSVVFFREVPGEGPLGAAGIPLTPGRSLAVDPNFIPLNAPLWLQAKDEKINRLVVAQDTGGAIKGPVRGDLFWGYGKEAEARAGAMQSGGTYFLLWPKKARLP